MRAQTGLSNKQIFNFLSKIVFSGSELDNTGATRLVIASATTVMTPPPFTINIPITIEISFSKIFL